MNKYLIPKLYGGLHGTMIAAHIAVTTNVPKRRKRSPLVWLWCVALLAAAAVVVWR